MSIRLHRLRNTAIAALGLAAGLSHAVTGGVTPTSASSIIVNPFTGQVTDAWKLVGLSTNFCKGVQISPVWIIASAHCGNNSTDPGNRFENYYGGAPIEAGSCGRVSGYSEAGSVRTNDVSLCRLSTPLTGAPAYPQLVKGLVVDRASANKMGNFMGFGSSLLGFPHDTGNPGFTVAFFAFSGLPHGYEPALGADMQPFPQVINGDSSSGLFWYSPGSNTPALVGVISSINGPHWGDNESPATTSWYFTEQNAADLNTIIHNNNVRTGRTDPALAFLTPDQYHAAPTGNPPSELPTPPVATWMGNDSIKLSWPSVSSPSGMNGYRITLGHDNNQAALRTSTALANVVDVVLSSVVASDKYAACVQPYNSVGHANAAWVPRASNVALETPNCVKFDTRAPAAVQGLSLSSSNLGSFAKVTATWGMQTAPTNIYQIESKLTYKSGPVRTTTTQQAVNLNSHAVTVVRGTKVCITVKGISAIQQAGASSSACITPQ